MPPLACEFRISLGIPRATLATVTIKVQPGGHAPVGRARVDMRIEHPGLFHRVAQRPECDQIMVMIHVKQQQDVGCRMGDHSDDGLHLRILAPQDIPQQKTWTLAGKARVKDSDLNRLRSCGKGWQNSGRDDERYTKNAGKLSDGRGAQTRCGPCQIICRLSAAA